MHTSGLYLFFAVEADSKSKSDYMYIQGVILHFYADRKHHRHPIYMGSKSNLTDIAKINAATKRARELGGEVHVIVCADKDVNDDDQNKRISKFCEDFGFDLVWMNQNIEHVFMNEANVPIAAKASMANDFLRKVDKKMDQFDIALLKEEDPLKKPRSSNLMLVLGKYIELRGK